MARTRKQGSVVKRGSRFALQLDVDGKRYLRAIRNPEDGTTATTMAQAKAWRDATAKVIREKASHKLQSALPLGQLEETYRRYLPTYTKRNGGKHVDATKEARIAPRTLQANIRTLAAFVGYLKVKHPTVRTSEDISQPEARGFMASRSDLKASSYNRYLFSLRHICNVIPHFAENPFASLEARTPTEVKRETTSKERFTGEQLATMQAKATGWIRPAMFIGYYTGLRLGDVATLRWDEIDGEFLKLLARKTSKEATIYAPEIMPYLAAWRERRALAYNGGASVALLARLLGTSTGTAWKVANLAGGLPDPASAPELVQWIHEACKIAAPHCRPKGIHEAAAHVPAIDLEPIPEELDGYVFPAQAARYLGIGRKPDQSGASKQFQAFLVACDIDTKNGDGETVLGFHSLRVTYATVHRIESGDIASTQKQLQHSNAKTTEGYDRRTEDERRRELREGHVAIPFPGGLGTVVAETSPEPERDELHRLLDSLPPEQVRELLAMAQDSEAKTLRVAKRTDA
jgi:integrase